VLTQGIREGSMDRMMWGGSLWRGVHQCKRVSRGFSQQEQHMERK